MSTPLRRPKDERGFFDHGWLQTHHTFSFGHYVDPAWTRFGALRVMNEDVIAPGEGFGTHGHQEMEILTWVLQGQLEHRDSLGHGEILRPSEMQWMSAGTGIRHSEFNPSKTEPTHLYQIWLFPRERGLAPAYAQLAFPEAERRDRFQVVAAGDGRDGVLPIRQDAVVSVADLTPGTTLEEPLDSTRRTWLQVLRGQVEVGDWTMTAGDGLGLSRSESLRVTAVAPSEVLRFDLPGGER